MKEEIRMSKDVVFKQVTTHQYIRKEVWHNPSTILKTLRVINKTILCLLAIILAYCLYYGYFPGEDIFYALMGMLIYLLFFSHGVSGVMNNIKLSSSDDSNESIRVETHIFEKYLNAVRGEIYFRSTFLMLFLFVALLVLGVAGKTTVSDDRAVYYIVSILSMVMAVVNSLYFNSLNMSFSKAIKDEIY